MVYWNEGLFLYIVSFLVQTQGIDPSCECVTFQSYGLSTGNFHSPDYPKPYHRGINCILYNFVGDVNEIVQIKFSSMDLRGPVPIGLNKSECKDWLRIYKNLDRGEINENVRHQDELCGSISSIDGRKEFYSSGRALIMEFHTDDEDAPQRYEGFKGVFTFLDKSAFETDGILRYGTQCTYDVPSGNNYTKGKFFTPRYPQKYPKLSDCHFSFMGLDNERVKVLFKLISLPNRSCGENGDTIKVYDGKDSSAKLLHTFCDNTHNQKKFESTGPYMYIEFHSDRRYEEQGFAAEYEFVDKWIPDVPVLPVLKCNESISSKERKNGTITSIDYPKSYSSGIICHYIFKAEQQERIQLKFTNVDLYYSAGDPDDPFGCPSQDSITVYTYEDDKEQQLEQFCGKKHPTQLMSSGQMMKVVFRSQNSQKDNNSGFRMEYSFRTDFGVQGLGVQDNRGVCTFMFRSTLHTTGFFTSPNYGGPYPRNTMCQYIFTGRINEVVEIDFPEFYVDGIIPRCDSPTDSDYVEFSNFLRAKDRKMRRYCGNRPKYDPVTSDAAFFRVIFKSNNKFDATGFKGTYKFKKVQTSAVIASSTETPINDRLSTGSRSQSHILVSTTTIILFCMSVIDNIHNIF